MTARYDVRCGDALRLLTDLEAGSVDAVVTDCPYSSGGMTRGDRAGTAHDKYVTSGTANRTLGTFEGDSRDQRGWTHWCAIWYAECWRVARPGAVLLSFTDWRQLPSTTDAVQAGGWVWRGVVPWNKGLGTRPQKGRFRQQCEYIVFATHGAHASYGEDAPCLPGFFECPSPQERDHITQKPIELMEELVRLVPEGSVVLDPFGGSGTTAAACIRARRFPITFEISPQNVELIRDRLEAELQNSTVADMRAGQVAMFPTAIT